jgi:hypothetical protein
VILVGSSDSLNCLLVQVSYSQDPFCSLYSLVPRISPCTKLCYTIIRPAMCRHCCCITKAWTLPAPMLLLICATVTIRKRHQGLLFFFSYEKRGMPHNNLCHRGVFDRSTCSISTRGRGVNSRVDRNHLPSRVIFNLDVRSW